MRISVIVSTFNSPKSLNKALIGYRCQTVKDFEIVIADDGSTSETADLIEKFRSETGVQLVHVRHDHQGFRKTVILNKAITASSGDYLIFTDGDCIPRKDFVRRHAKAARPSCFTTGMFHRLPPQTSESITHEDIVSGACFRPKWLQEHGYTSQEDLTKLAIPPFFAPIVDFASRNRPHWAGGNSAAWRRDIIAVNGFNEKMRYGGEDTEFGVRLMNFGVRVIRVRNSAVVLHMEHERPYRSEEEFASNRAVIEESRKNGTICCEEGLIKRSLTAAGG